MSAADWRAELLLGLSPSEQCWLIALAERPKVGPNKTLNYESLRGKVQALAKNHGLDGIDVRRGFKDLTSRSHQSPAGKSAINNDDKSNGLLRLWPLGKALVAYLEANVGFRDDLLRGLGSELAAPQRWSPLPREGARISFSTETPRPTRQPAPLRIDCEFTCGQCRQLVKDSYDMVWGEDNWNLRDVACTCGAVWRHSLLEEWPLERVS